MSDHLPHIEHRHEPETCLCGQGGHHLILINDPALQAKIVVIEAFLRALLEEPLYRRIMRGDGPLQRLRHSLKQAFGRPPEPQGNRPSSAYG